MLSSIMMFSMLHGFIARGLATDISTYRDTECKISQDNINGPNGYPDGTCTLFSERTTSNYSSFQVVDQDPGCSVTIYGSNSNSSLSCSSTTLRIADVAHCYNTSWLYYSIDNCTPPDEILSSTASTSASAGTSTSVGATVGGVIGGATLLGGVAGAIFFLGRKRKRTREAAERETRYEQLQPPQELSSEGMAELEASAGVEVKYELPSNSKPSELTGARSPVEMEGDVQFPVRDA